MRHRGKTCDMRCAQFCCKVTLQGMVQRDRKIYCVSLLRRGFGETVRICCSSEGPESNQTKPWIVVRQKRSRARRGERADRSVGDAGRFRRRPRPIRTSSIALGPWPAASGPGLARKTAPHSSPPSPRDRSSGEIWIDGLFGGVSMVYGHIFVYTCH